FFRFVTSPTGRGILAIAVAMLVLLSATIFLAVGPSSPLGWLGQILIILACATGAYIILAAGGAGLLLYMLRRDEEAASPDDQAPNLAAMQEIAEGENQPGYTQNHILAVTPLKPGWFRKLTLAASLWGIKQLVTFWYRPGFVLNMGTIHYAKWFRLPATDPL